MCILVTYDLQTFLTPYLFNYLSIFLPINQSLYTYLSICILYLSLYVHLFFSVSFCLLFGHFIRLSVFIYLFCFFTAADLHLLPSFSIIICRLFIRIQLQTYINYLLPQSLHAQLFIRIQLQAYIYLPFSLSLHPRRPRVVCRGWPYSERRRVKRNHPPRRLHRL